MDQKKIHEYASENDYELLYLISENNEEANELIFKKYNPIIEYYAKKYLPLVSNKGIDYNDLYQEGLIGLNSAIEGYRDQKDIKFSTFAFICIKRRIFSAIRIASRKKHSILNDSYSIEDNINSDNMTYYDVISDDEDNIEDKIINKEMKEEFNKRLNTDLTSFEREVYNLRINGFSYEEIAKALDKTIKSIECTISRIKIKLRKIMEEIN